MSFSLEKMFIMLKKGIPNEADVPLTLSQVSFAFPQLLGNTSSKFCQYPLRPSHLLSLYLKYIVLFCKFTYIVYCT